ncbi:hypothetical protein JCM19992_20150 [Thermostilla marina]
MNMWLSLHRPLEFLKSVVSVTGILIAASMLSGCSPPADAFLPGGAGTGATAFGPMGTGGAMVTATVPAIPMDLHVRPPRRTERWQRQAAASELLRRLSAAEQAERAGIVEPRLSSPASDPNTEKTAFRFRTATQLLNEAVTAGCEREMLESLVMSLRTASDECCMENGPGNLRQEVLFVFSLAILHQNVPKFVLEYRPYFTLQGRLGCDRWPDIVAFSIAAIDSYEDTRAGDFLVRMVLRPEATNEPMRCTGWAAAFLQAYDVNDFSIELAAQAEAMPEPAGTKTPQDSLWAMLGTDSPRSMLEHLSTIDQFRSGWTDHAIRTDREYRRYLWRTMALSPLTAPPVVYVDQLQQKNHLLSTPPISTEFLLAAAPEGTVEALVAKKLYQPSVHREYFESHLDHPAISDEERARIRGIMKTD